MFAAVVHYYYRDSWEMMRAQLKHVSHLLDIYFTTPDEKREEAEREIRPLFPEAKIISRPNGGMDIGPFLSVLPELKARGYTHVCKLHTKDVKDQVSRLWFSWLIRALIGNEGAVKTVQKAFLEDQRVTSIGVAGLFLSARRSMFGNISTVESLYRRVYGTDLPLDDWGFFAGTMFWSRLDRLLPVAEEALGMTELFDKACGDDGHLVHALERVMGCVWNHDQLQVGLLHPTHLDSSGQDIIVEKSNRSISNYYSGEAICRYFYLENDLQSLRSSGGFKDYLYAPVITDAHQKSVDAAAHYCLIGSSRSFNPPVVGSIHPEILEPRWLDEFGKRIAGWGLARNPLAFIMGYEETLPIISKVFSHKGFLDQLDAFRQTGCFNEDHYKSQISPGYLVDMSLDRHYLSCGYKVGIQPFSGFDPLKYLVDHPELLDQGIEPSLHFLRTAGYLRPKEQFLPFALD